MFVYLFILVFEGKKLGSYCTFFSFFNFFYWSLWKKIMINKKNGNFLFFSHGHMQPNDHQVILTTPKF